MPLINFNYFDSGSTSDEVSASDTQAVIDGMTFSRRIIKYVISVEWRFHGSLAGDRREVERLRK